MADPSNISNILAALAAQRNSGTPTQSHLTPMPSVPYPPQYGPPPGAAPPYGLPQPISSGSVDLGNIKPVSSGSVSIADAIAKARNIAVEKGVSYDPNRALPRHTDPRMGDRGYRRSRSPSRTPPRTNRDTFRDNYNPYRDERRGGNDRGYRGDRSLSPRPASRGYPPAGQSYGGSGSPRRNTGGDGESEVLPIEKSLVGLIIGRAGENLRRVEGMTGARVQFMDGPETGSSSRHCKISGSRAAVAGAKAEIFKIIEDNEVAKRGQDKPRGGGGGGGGGRNQPAAPSTDDGDSEQIMVPDRTVGLIIGRGGETIRDLQERSGCHVNIVGENKSVNGFRPVNLIGNPQQQQNAKDLIYEIVESDTKSGGGGSRPDAPPVRDDPYSGQGNFKDTIMVPGDAVGMIIGKGGESIKEMQNVTGCKINVSQASGRDIEREIGLVASSQHAIDAAKRAIMEKVDAVDQRNRSGGGGGGGRDRRNDDPYADRYSSQQPQAHPAAGMGAMPQAPQPQPQAPGGADPYAAYGGYNAYVTMWYAAMQAQQQQPPGGPPGPGEQR